MTNRKLALIVKDQHPLMLQATATLQEASRRMWDKCVGSVLIVDETDALVGIFTGRDAVKALAQGRDPATTALSDVMTKNPVTITPDKRAIDALRTMGDGGFRHLPIVDSGRIKGIVSRGDFRGDEIGRIDCEQHLWETLM